jgi:hypothetical protein
MLSIDVSTWESSNQDKILEHFKKLHVPEELILLISGLTLQETVSIFFKKQKMQKLVELLTFRGQISA